MRIHQITDLHVPDSDDDENFSHVRSNVLRQLAFVASEKPDLLVISGDLTLQDASEKAYQWIKAALPDVPVKIIPGNHDDPEILWEIFGSRLCPNSRFYGVEQYGDVNVVYLNTQTETLPTDQVAFLSGLNLICTTRSLLFMHHPPHLIGGGYMSLNQPLKNHEETAQAIIHSGIEHVFCGHYHNRADVSCRGFELHLTPSPAYQISLESEQFEMQDFEVVVRTINIDANGVSTELVSV